jgi:hypothetical protein
MDADNTPFSPKPTDGAGRPRRRTRRLVTGLLVAAAAVTLSVAGLTSTATTSTSEAAGPVSSVTTWLVGTTEGVRGSSWAASYYQGGRGSSWS